MLLVRSSLERTIDAVSEAHFQGRALSARERLATARWIAEHQGLPGSYANMFGPTPGEGIAQGRGILLFTGERATNAAARHILGEEACRALRLLKVRDQTVAAALDAATQNVARCIGPVKPRTPKPGQQDRWAIFAGGVFCCGKCSVAMWRHLLAGGLDQPEQRIAVGLKCLKSCRKNETGNGQWRVYPLWYTLSALVEMAEAGICVPAVKSEIRYIAPQVEKTVRSSPAPRSVFAQRRREVARRALAVA